MFPPDKPKDRPTVPQVLPLVNQLYKTFEGGSGCCLHIVLDDNNINDHFIEYCLEIAEQKQHTFCQTICKLLLQMTLTQRHKICGSHD